jgi:hypothetical protein
MRSARSRNLTAVLALGPVLALWIWKVFVRPRPFWVHYFDPETSFFYEGLRILAGGSPFNVDNPGTPVQLASAAIALFTGTSPLSYPTFIAAAHACGLALTVAATFLLVHTALRDAPPAAALAAIWTWFLSPQAFEYQMVWSPEIFYFGFGVLGIVAIARALSVDDVRRDALAGAAVGLLIATKFVFIGWLAALCIALWSVRRALIAVAGAVGAFGVVTAVAWPRYPAMAAWLTKLAMNSEMHGRGSRGLPLLSDVLGGYAHTVLTAKAWMLWLLVVLVCGVLAYRDGSKRLVIFAASASAIVAVMAMRAPAFRYLMPISLCAVLVVGLARRRTAVLAVLAALLLTKAIRRDIDDHRTRIDSLFALRARVESALPSGTVVYGWRFSTPSFALRINATNDAQRNEIARVYPSEGHYNDWTREIFLPPGASRWDVLVIDESLLPGFPEPVGRTAGQFGTYRMILAPGR